MSGTSKDADGGWWAVEEDGGRWVVGYVDSDGIFNTTEGDPAYPTRREAERAMCKMLSDLAEAETARRWYQIGCDYACGYRS